MKVKTYKAMDMQEAIRQIKKDLGAQAVILSTRKVVEGRRAFGLLGRPMVEVTAAVDGLPPNSQRRASSPKEVGELHSGPGAKMLDMIRVEIQDLRNEVHGLVQASRIRRTDLHPEVEQGLAELRWLASYVTKRWSRAGGEGQSEQWERNFLRLVRQGVKEAHAQRILERIDWAKCGANGGGDEGIQQHLARLLSRLVRVIPIYGSYPLVLALVGPTGVGKTTTAAKIAAHCALEEGRKVALITNDTYRIAAVEQLRIYARIMRVPLEVVLHPTGLSQVLDDFSDRDVIVIDTAGRSPFNEVQMAELREFLAADRRVQSLLLVSANTDARELERVIQHFSPLGPVGLIVTKLDEAKTFGALFSASIQSRLPFAFFTNGQRVPEDISQATREEVARWTLWGIEAFHQGARLSAARG